MSGTIGTESQDPSAWKAFIAWVEQLFEKRQVELTELDLIQLRLNLFLGAEPPS